MPYKSEVLTTVECPKCKAKIEILQKREVIEPSVKAIIETTYAVRLSNQSKLG